MEIGLSLSIASPVKPAGALSVSIGSGPFVTGTLMTISVVGDKPGDTVEYRWLNNGLPISDRTEQSYGPAIGIDGIEDRSLVQGQARLNGGAWNSSAAREIRYAPIVSAGALPDQTFIVGEVVDLDLAGDFTLNGNTPTFGMIGLPSGLADDGDGTISGAPDTDGQSGLVTITATDAYGRETSSSLSFRTEAFSLSETAEGTMQIDGVSGTFTITITSPARFADYDAGSGAGIFIFDSSDLATGPVNLVPPQIIDGGTPASGEELTLTPGLWVYDPDVGNLGTPSYQWQADAAGNGTFADISGATSSAYTLTSSESGDDVRVLETLSDDGGSRTATSAAASVAAGGGYSALYTDDFTSYGSDQAWTTVADIDELYANGGSTATIIAADDKVTFAEGNFYDGIAVYYSGAIGADQKAVAELSSQGFSVSAMTVMVRASVGTAGDKTTLNGYGVEYRPDLGTNGILRLLEFNNGTGTTIGSDYDLPNGTFDGQRIEIEVTSSGNDAVVKVHAELTDGGGVTNDVITHTFTSAAHTSGAPALRYFASSSNTNRNFHVTYAEFGEFI